MRCITILAAVAGLASTTAAMAQTEFMYQGQLKDAGLPGDGEYDFIFRAYNAPTGGSQIGSLAVVNDWSVANGLFTVQLDFGSSVFDGNPRWLQVEVRPGASGGSYTTLVPRQPLTAVPYAMYAFGGPGGGGGFWSPSGSHIFNTNAGRVGVGTDAPEAPLHVFGGSAGTVTAHANSSAAFERAGANYLSILSPTASERGLLFGDPSSFVNGGIIYNSASVPNGFQFRTAVNTTRMVITEPGNVGIGTITPNAKVQLVGDGSGTVMRLTNGGSCGSMTNTALIVGDVCGSGRAASFFGITSNNLVTFQNDGAGDAARFVGNVSFAAGNVGIGTTAPSSRLHLLNSTSTALANFSQLGVGGGVLINLASTSNNNPALTILQANSSVPAIDVGGTIRTQVLQITGADVAEKFPTSETDAVEPGTVMEIDSDNPGRLRIARGACNRRVAGVVSGAGDLHAGAVLGHMPGHEDAPAIALSGRVWVRCDAGAHAIAPGDLLTTSDTPGHAMKVTDYARAQGAIIGKAMTGLVAGKRGLVLVLVSLQ